MPELVAVVDLGSTAIRLLLARIVSGAGYQVLVEKRVPTRLGGGAPGRLPRAAIDDTLRAVHRFFRRHTGKRQGPRIVAVATSAVRDATNRERLLGPLRRLEGIDVEVLSARDEARLGVEAALHRLRFRNGIVADLGGASLQLSRVRRRKVGPIASLPLGAVRTTRRFLRHDPPRPRELHAMRSEVRRQLEDAVPLAGRGDVMVGLGGTVRTLASIHVRAHPSEREHRNGLQLWQSDVTAIRERLEGHSQRKHRTIRGLKAERADIILAGAIVIEEVMVVRRIPDARGLHERCSRRLAPAGNVRWTEERSTVNADAFVNRELSWLEFNGRVLEEAQDPSVPLLERVKFLAIFSSNLDEFFMVRVAALKRRLAAGDQTPGLDGLAPAATLAAIATRVRELVAAQRRCFREEIEPRLAAEGIVVLRPKGVSETPSRSDNSSKSTSAARCSPSSPRWPSSLDSRFPTSGIVHRVSSRP